MAMFTSLKPNGFLEAEDFVIEDSPFETNNKSGKNK
jgi:hypothetical protein